MGIDKFLNDFKSILTKKHSLNINIDTKAAKQFLIENIFFVYSVTIIPISILIVILLMLLTGNQYGAFAIALVSFPLISIIMVLTFPVCYIIHRKYNNRVTVLNLIGFLICLSSYISGLTSKTHGFILFLLYVFFTVLIAYNLKKNNHFLKYSIESIFIFCVICGIFTCFIK